jgi:DNA polymerase-3 subunit alpha
MDIAREWIRANKEEVLDKLNAKIFMDDWNKYAKGSYSSWEMEVMCFYYHEHELANVNKGKYGLMNFYDLPEEPIVDRTFPKGNVMINMYKLTKICGTCIAKNKDKGLVTLLTVDGVVTVRFRKEYFALFDKQISAKGDDGKKHVVEKSWFKRGSLIVVQGMRRGDEFVAKKYASSGGHQLYKIQEVLPNGDLILQTERNKGEMEDDD